MVAVSTVAEKLVMLTLFIKVVPDGVILLSMSVLSFSDIVLLLVSLYCSSVEGISV